MVIVTGHKQTVKDEMHEIIVFTGTEVVPCPVCSGRLKLHGTCMRKLQEADGTVLYRLRVLECTECGKTHRELPPWIIPFKRMALDVLNDISESDNANLEIAESSTWYRIKAWVAWFLGYAMHVLQALLVSDQSIQTIPTGAAQREKLAYSVRVVANSGRWIQHRSAMTNGW